MRSDRLDKANSNKEFANPAMRAVIMPPKPRARKSFLIDQNLIVLNLSLLNSFIQYQKTNYPKQKRRPPFLDSPKSKSPQQKSQQLKLPKTR